MKNKKIYIISILWIVIDQVIKLLIKLNIHIHEKIVLIPNFFKLYYVENDGAAFSSFSGMKYFLIIISILIFIFLIKYLNNNKINKKLGIIAYGLVIGGLIGNLIDRIICGNVIDYLSFTVFKYDFAVFNFADIGITIGVVLLLISKGD